MEITKKFTDPLTRQANEAVRISTRSPQELLKSKAEFNHPPLSRVVVQRKAKQFSKKNDKTPISTSKNSS